MEEITISLQGYTREEVDARVCESFIKTFDIIDQVPDRQIADQYLHDILGTLSFVHMLLTD